MPFALNFYHDQIDASGSTASALPAAHRLLYVRHGNAVINGQSLSSDQATYCHEPVTLQSSGDWAQIWRWELAAPNALPLLHEGTGVLSSLRMSRVIANLAMLEGTRWLLRLDRITSAAGRIADRHQHPGPGIRCLVEGTFNVQQDAESHRDLAPGDAWWETGSDTVVAWGSRQMAAKFMRGMALPTEWEGKVTGTWLSGEVAVASAGQLEALRRSRHHCLTVGCGRFLHNPHRALLVWLKSTARYSATPHLRPDPATIPLIGRKQRISRNQKVGELVRDRSGELQTA